MGEAQNIGISLDSKSIEILKKVDAIHRDSLINVGLALVEKTGYYKTLAGINSGEDLEDVASLDVDEIKFTNKKTAKKQIEVKETPKKPTTTWDSF